MRRPFVFPLIAASASLGLTLVMCGGDAGETVPDPDASLDGVDGAVAPEERDGASVVDAGVDATRDSASDASDAGTHASDAADAALDATIDADGGALPPGTITKLVVGAQNGCVLRLDGRVKCWGNGNFAGLGIAFPDNRGDAPNEMGALLPFVDVGPNRSVVNLFSGSYADHRCAILDDGALKCWGANVSGDLGLGDTATRGDGANEMGADLTAIALGTNVKAAQVATNNAHTCAILTDGRLKCWGNNGDGQLGVGDTAARGDAPGEMGDALPFVDIGAGRTAKAVMVANARTCIITDQDRVRCWGSGTNGQLGQGNTQGRGTLANQMGAALPDIDLGAGRTAKAIAGGLEHTCAILDDGSVKCWGSNVYGQLGLGDTANRGDGPNEMGDDLPKVSLGAGRTAKAIASGASHVCVILDDDTLKCWGQNNVGQLGQGDTARRGDGAGEMGDNLPAIALGAGRTAKAIAMGTSSSCALLDDGKVKCWGLNSYGHLGIGDTANRGDGNNEMGDNLPAVDTGP